ncbi:MAG: transcriptional regulator PpsR [Pseudomonadales bacterium]|nr:transcriptional regulator PpsR [Pseudomonadales bacterium]
MRGPIEVTIDLSSAGALLRAAADIVLLLDGDGIVLDVVVNDAKLARTMQPEWIGRPWLETVTEESRPRLRELLEEAARESKPAEGEVNHPVVTDRAVRLVRYCVTSVAGSEGYLALGRDLDEFAELQQRLLAAQEEAALGYQRARHAEVRFRLLCEQTPDPVLVVDLATQRVIEANPAAHEELGLEHAPTRVRVLSRFRKSDVARVREVLRQALVSGHATSAEGVRLKVNERSWQLTVVTLGRDSGAVFMLRRPHASAAYDARDPDLERLRALVMRGPDAVVVTDSAGQVLWHNSAFSELAGLEGDGQAIGAPLSAWLGRRSSDVQVLIANLRQRGVVRLFAATIATRQGMPTDVEVSGVALPDGRGLCCGFVIRSVVRRTGEAPAGFPIGKRSLDQLVELVGTLPLKEVVRESTEVIERLGIEAALRLTGDNRAAAAEMLGLSRQSLYVKLRRYGIGGLGDDRSVSQAETAGPDTVSPT